VGPWGPMCAPQNSPDNLSSARRRPYQLTAVRKAGTVRHMKRPW